MLGKADGPLHTQAPPDNGILRCLGDGDPPPYQIINGEATTPILLICDHASQAIPFVLGRLGLEDDALRRHIAYDIGAAALTRLLATRLDAPAVLCGYSRLVIDCNRPPGDPQSILEVSDGTVIPGNVGLSAAQQEARAEAVHWPYHHAIENTFTRLRRLGPEPILFSVHTFTPSLAGEDRLWDLGVLWHRDPRVAVPLISLLREEDGLTVGDNEPYSGLELAYSLDLHAGSSGLANVAIEVRQDHCTTSEELERWADLLAAVLRKIMAMPGVHTIGSF